MSLQAWTYRHLRCSSRKQLRPPRIRQKSNTTRKQRGERRYQPQPPVWRVHRVEHDNRTYQQQSGEESAEPRYKGANGSVRSIGDAFSGAFAVLRSLHQHDLSSIHPTNLFSNRWLTHREHEGQMLMRKVGQTISSLLYPQRKFGITSFSRHSLCRRGGSWAICASSEVTRLTTKGWSRFDR